MSAASKKPYEETWTCKEWAVDAIVLGENGRSLLYSSERGAVDMDAPTAHLIAAAPELYRMLEAAVKDKDGNLPIGWYDMAKAALMKARGEVAK